MKRLAFVVALLVLGIAPSGLTQSRPASFAFTTFDAPFLGAVETENLGINNLGVSVGDYCVDVVGNQCHGYRRSAFGVFTPIDVPGAFETDPFGINISGAIVGQYFLAGRHCFMLDASGFTPIPDVPFPGSVGPGLGTGCRAINDLGQIVGIYLTRDSAGQRHRHGFLFRGGLFTSIDAPVAGTTDTVPRGINNAGRIVGRYVVNGANHGFLLDGTTFTPIDYPLAVETVAAGINNRGQIVGIYRDVNNFLFGFMRTTDMSSNSSGTVSPPIYTQIVLPGPGQNTGGAPIDSLAFSSSVAAVNDRGQISGEYWGIDNRVHGFVTAPRQEFEVTGSALVGANPITGTFDGDPTGEGTFTLTNLFVPRDIPFGLFINCGRAQPSLLLTTSTGDQIFADLLVTACQTAFEPVPFTGVVSGFYRITGGTGRFGGTSGSGFVRGTFQFPGQFPGTLTFTLEGSITR